MPGSVRLTPSQRGRRRRATDLQALEWPEMRRLMIVPGVNLMCAASCIAVVGDPHRFFTGRKLVAYLGLDPKVGQSGDAPPLSGRISKARLRGGALGLGRRGS